MYKVYKTKELESMKQKASQPMHFIGSSENLDFLFLTFSGFVDKSIQIKMDLICKPNIV